MGKTYSGNALAQAFNVQVEKPLDVRAVVGSVNDLTQSATWGGYSYPGMMTVVKGTDQQPIGDIYVLTAADFSDINNWKKIGSGDLNVEIVDVVRYPAEGEPYDFYESTDVEHENPLHTAYGVNEAGKYLKVTSGENISYTKVDVDLSNYYTKSQADTNFAGKSVETTVGDANSGLVKDVADLQTTVGDSNSGLVKEVSDIWTAIGDINQFEYVLADQLPEASAETMYKIYLIPKANAGDDDIKDEYITVRTEGEESSPVNIEEGGESTELDNYIYSWELIGSTAIDVSNKADKPSQYTAGHLTGIDSNGNLTDSGLAKDAYSKLAASYQVTLETAQAQDRFTIAASTHHCGTLPMVAVYYAGKLVDADVQISSAQGSEGDVTVAWSSNTTISQSYPLTIKLLNSQS